MGGGDTFPAAVKCRIRVTLTLVHSLRGRSPLWRGRRSGKSTAWLAALQPQSGSREEGTLERGSLSAFTQLRSPAMDWGHPHPELLSSGWTSAAHTQDWSPVNGLLQPTSRAGFPTSVRPLWKHPHRHTWRCVSTVILNTVN